jgi:hypothetical protein
MGRGRATVKVKKILPKESEDDSNLLNNMFEQMTGSQNADRDIIIPKIINIFINLKKYNKLLNLILTFSEFRNTFIEYEDWFEEIKIFNDDISNINGFDINTEYNIYLPSCLGEINEKENTALNNFYKDLKNNKFIKKIIITSNILSKYKKNIEDPNDLSDVFINREPGLTLLPFCFSNFDLKVLWCSENITPQIKKYILSILSHVYKIGLEFYNIISSPDIDIKKFSKILVESISKMRKQIPRCNDAFNIIEKSVLLLEDNFKGYYRSSVEAENPSIIIENFIVDVSMTQKASPMVTSQFRKIVAHLQKNSKNSNDPKVKKLFSMLNNQFTMMDNELGVKTDVPDDESTNESTNDVIDEQTNESTNDVLDEPTNLSTDYKE